MKVLRFSLPALFLSFAVADAHTGHTFTGKDHPLANHDAAEAHPELPFEIGAAAYWDSRDVGEGRDGLEGDSLASAEILIGYAGFELGAWVAESPDQDYTEYNYRLGYSYEWEAFTFSVGYTFLDLVTDEEDDQEYSAEIAWALPHDFELILGGYYSVESEGTFYEASLSKTFELSETVSLVPFGTLGYNDGFVVEGHDGLNHFALGLELVWELNDYFSLAGFVAGNFEIDANADRYADDEALKDFAYGGVSVSFVY